MVHGATSKPGGSCLALSKDKFLLESCLSSYYLYLGWVGDDSIQGEEDGAQTNTAMAWDCHRMPNMQLLH